MKFFEWHLKWFFFARKSYSNQSLLDCSYYELCSTTHIPTDLSNVTLSVEVLQKMSICSFNDHCKKNMLKSILL